MGWRHSKGLVLAMKSERWGRLSTMDRLISQGTTMKDNCMSCGQLSKYVNYIFYHYAYSSWVLKKSLEIIGNLINPTRPRSSEDLGDLINKITIGTVAWELTWTVISFHSWMLWRKRNQRLKLGTHYSKEVLPKSIIGAWWLAFRRRSSRKVLE